MSSLNPSIVYPPYHPRTSGLNPPIVYPSYTRAGSSPSTWPIWAGIGSMLVLFLATREPRYK